MALLFGTTDALYLVDEPGFEDPDPVLEPGHVRGLARHGGTVFVAAGDGVFRSSSGERWEPVDAPRDGGTDLPSPEDGATAVRSTADYLYVGTRPARVFRYLDRDKWYEADRFTDVPGHDDWVHGGGGPAQVRSFAWHPDAPERLLVGVESAGALLTENQGLTWVRRDEGLNDDVHHVRALGPRRFVAATGGGLYRTDDAGRTWVRCDTHVDRFHQRYCRETLVHDGALYAGLAGSGPFWDGDDGANAALVRSTDGGRTLVEESYPGGPEAFVVSFASWDGRPVGGTNEGTVLARDAGGWEPAGSVPVTDRARGAYGITAMLEL